MVNRYITALLVALAATGIEAQTYQQALKFALTDISYDELIQQPEAKALKEDLLCIIKAIKNVSNQQDECQQHFFKATLAIAQADNLADFHPAISFFFATRHKYRAPYGSIVIRGPDFL